MTRPGVLAPMHTANRQRLGPSAMDERLAQGAAAQPMVVRCAWCPDWSYEGTAEQGRAEAEKHRRRRHRGLVVGKRRRRRARP